MKRLPGSSGKWREKRKAAPPACSPTCYLDLSYSKSRLFLDIRREAGGFLINGV